jgi:hypothetical protein
MGSNGSIEVVTKEGNHWGNTSKCPLKLPNNYFVVIFDVARWHPESRSVNTLTAALQSFSSFNNSNQGHSSTTVVD